MNFSFDNIQKITYLTSDSTISVLVRDIFNYHDKNKGLLDFSTDENSFISIFSELLTFSFFSLYLNNPDITFENLLKKYHNSDKLFFSEILAYHSEKEIIYFFRKLQFDELFNYLEENLLEKVLSKLEDPFTFVYENFLVKYNKNILKKTGSYYSPIEPVQFISSSIEKILLKNSAFPDIKGKINFLDPSCGTGPFLIEILKLLKKYSNKIYAKDLDLQINGFDINPVSIFLTFQNFLNFIDENNLSELIPVFNLHSISLLKDIEKIQKSSIDSDYILRNVQSLQNLRNSTCSFQIIFGNPPYSAVSNNANNWINNLLKGKINGYSTHNYFEVNGVSIKEKKSGWLYDDYVKFIRFSHWLIDKSDQGILSYICNNGFLSNPSFRGMRFQLMETFDAFYILDLHGNKIVDTPPNNIKDDNIFNITQGICIFIFIKTKNSHCNEKNFYYYDLWGLKEEKLHFLHTNDLGSISWKGFSPSEPFYTFIPEDSKIKNLYSTFWSIKDIFTINGTGLITSKDSLTIQFSKDEMLHLLNDFSKIKPEIARKKYNLGNDTENWKVHTAQQDITEHGISENHISTILYRPFDTRFTYFTGKSNGFHGRPKGISSVLFYKSNIALISARTNKTGNNDHFFVSSTLTEAKCAESSTQSYIFPLKTFDTDNNEVDNINPEFISILQSKFGIDYNASSNKENIVSSEDILAYIYALFYSDSYRKAFKSFLFYDFPRVPIIKDFNLFCKLMELGHQLLTLHLLNFDIPSKLDINTFFTHDGKITKISYKDNKLFVNKYDYFYPIQNSTYIYTIGNYKVLRKWLIGRKNRILSTNEIIEFKKIIFALEETQKITGMINKILPINLFLSS